MLRSRLSFGMQVTLRSALSVVLTAIFAYEVGMTFNRLLSKDTAKAFHDIDPYDEADPMAWPSFTFCFMARVGKRFPDNLTQDDFLNDVIFELGEKTFTT